MMITASSSSPVLSSWALQFLRALPCGRQNIRQNVQGNLLYPPLLCFHRGLLICWRCRDWGTHWETLKGGLTVDSLIIRSNSTTEHENGHSLVVCSALPSYRKLTITANMDVDWVWHLFRKTVPRHTQPGVIFPARDASSHDSRIRKINDHVYEVSNPVGRRPSVELVFFHGLQLEDSREPHVDTWLCRDASELWLNWILSEIPNARILTVSYDAHVNTTDEQGCSDMYITTENLLQDLIGTSPAGAEVGQDGCPVVFVGHCLGGVVMKQLCVYANSKLNVISGRLKQPMQNFLDNTKGFFFYASPHQGTRLADLETPSVKGPLFASLTTLNTKAARQNEDFRMLCQNRGWGTFAIGESHASTQGKFKGLFVEEASARHNVDEFYTVFYNHMNVCRPESKLSSNFTKLLSFVGGVVTKAQLYVHECALPENAIALESRAWDVQRKLLGGAILGIFGMGGIGKTTLAKKVFNNISKDFEYTCFLEYYKDIKIENFKEYLLQEVYYKGRKLDTPLAEFYELQNKRILIVLDDIVSHKQLEVIPKMQNFQQGSCLIITSRDKTFSKYREKCITYDVDFLNPDEAKKLFCLHVFGLEPIPYLLVDNVNEVVAKCAGLPLTLEVVGRHLRGHATEVEIWKETLDKLTRAEVLEGKNDTVWASLKVSYDGLSKEEQEMFVEAATVFHQEPKEIAVAAWSTHIRHPHTTWLSLVNRSMVRAIRFHSYLNFDLAKPDEKVWVHEQLRDMAKKIEDFQDYGMLSGHDENAKLVVDLLNAKEVKAKTRKVQLSHSMDVGLRLDSLFNLERLKSLDLNEVLCEGSQRGFSPNLSVLRCNGLIRPPKRSERLCCLESFSRGRLSTFNFNLSRMDKLAVLGVECCVVPEDFPKALGNLKRLRNLWLTDLEGLDHLAPNFGNLVCLKTMAIRSLRSLKLPEEFRKLVALETLELSNIHSLELPKSLGDLRSLVIMKIHDIDGLAGLPDSFGNLQKLKVLVITGCPLIKRLPGGFSKLSKLERLNVVDCCSLEELGEGFGELSSLQGLVLRDVAVKMLPVNFGRLSALKELTLQTDSLRSLSDDFVQLPAPLPTLKTLVVSSSELGTLPEGFHFLQSLETMAMVNCSKLERLPNDLGHVSSLREVRLRNCKKLTSLPGSWGKPSMSQLELPQGHESHEVRRQVGESSQTNATEAVRLLIYGCPLLDDSLLGSLSGVHVVSEGGLASPSFSRDEKQSWIGYWTQNADKGVFTIELCFATNNGISGGGVDEVGQFTCTGEWQGSQVHFVKQYTGRHKVQCDGEISNNTINGTWIIKKGRSNCLSNLRGEFHLALRAASPS